MLYLPELRTKILLVILLGLFTFHLCFISSKSYQGKYKYESSQTEYNQEYLVTQANYEQYQNFLNTISSGYDRRSFVTNTKEIYFFNLPSTFSYVIYVGYFLVFSVLILSSKFTLNASENEK